MKQNINFTLALEPKPNSFEPISIFNSLKNIDDLTSLYNESELNDLLFEEHLIEKKDYNVRKVIIFNNNGIRKVKDGLLYKDEAVLNINAFIYNFFDYFQYNNDAINEIYQFIVSKKNISDDTKKLLKNINNFKKDNKEYNNLLDNLSCLPYYDIRTIYFYLIRVILPKIEKEVTYSKSYKIS